MKPLTKNLSKGTWGAEILNLKRALNKLGYGEFIPTPYFGDDTRSAVIKFQRDYMINPTAGNVGPQTRKKLNELLGFTKGQILHAVAVSMLGIDASPQDIANDRVACAESVNNIAELALGKPIGGYLSTAEMYKSLESNPSMYHKLVEGETPMAGDIIISPTGHGNGSIVGHVGIFFDSRWIMSNSSSDGKFKKNFTIDGWKMRYKGVGALPVDIYRLL